MISYSQLVSQLMCQLVSHSVGVLVSYIQQPYLKYLNISDLNNYKTYMNICCTRGKQFLNFIWQCYLLSGCPADIEAYQRSDNYHWTVFHKVIWFELIIKMFNSFQVMLSCHSLKNMEVSYVSYIMKIFLSQVSVRPVHLYLY